MKQLIKNILYPITQYVVIEDKDLCVKTYIGFNLICYTKLHSLPIENILECIKAEQLDKAKLVRSYL